MFDFKNDKGQQIFKVQTTETTEFTDCFNDMSSVLDQCDKWLETLGAHCKTAYPIIKIRVKKKETTAADKMITESNKLIKAIKNGKDVNEEEIVKLEEQISDIISKEEKSKANKFLKYCNDAGSINLTEMWKLKKHIRPKKTKSKRRNDYKSKRS